MNKFRMTVAIAGLLLATCIPTVAADKTGPVEPALPAADQVLSTVTRYFAGKRNYQPGDLVSQADWDALVKLFTKSGWTPQDSARIRASLLPEKSFLVRQSQRPAGRDFLRRINRLPQGYDCLDHLSQLSTGEATIARLIDGPDGDKLIEYMTSAAGGTELGAMLSDAPGGKGFNRPTGHIYTANQLLPRINDSLHAERVATEKLAAEREAAAKKATKAKPKNKPHAKQPAQ